MDKICRHCNLIWKDADNIRFCTTCGRPLEVVNPEPENRQNSGYDPYSAGAGTGNSWQNGGYDPRSAGGGTGNGGQNGGYGFHPSGEIPKDNIIDSYKKFWRQYFDFNGRSRRADYWQVILVNIIIGVILGAFSNIPYIGMLFQVIYALYTLAALIPGIAIGVRRLHDIGKSGLYYLFILIPIVGSIILIVWFATDSEPGQNMYGPNPKWIYDSSPY